MAGEQLNNCLRSAQFNNPVICMMKNGRYVAAIEVDEKKKLVIQALIKDNEDIEDDKSIYIAFKKWCKGNNFCYNPNGFPYVEAF